MVDVWLFFVEDYELGLTRWGYSFDACRLAWVYFVVHNACEFIWTIVCASVDQEIREGRCSVPHCVFTGTATVCFNYFYAKTTLQQARRK
jgi:hypothetical protein